MSQPDIVKIIQKSDCWSGVSYEEHHGSFGVSVYFKNRADANAFKVELMMVASGQHGYEKGE